MATLEDTLRQLRERIRRSRSSHINEQNTKAALIDPILRALGWDVEDWEEVQREFRVQSGDNPVDYALTDRETKKALLFLEAKALNENLEDRKWAGQIMGYAHVAGVKWVVLTNGDEYRIYNAYAEGPVEQKIFRKTCVTDEASEPGATLVLLSKQSVKVNEVEVAWQIQVVDQSLRSAVEELFVPTPDPALVNLIRKRIPDVPLADIRAGLQRVGIRFGSSLAPPPWQAKSLAKPDVREPEPPLTERHRRHLRFWGQLLDRAREAGVTTHARVSPGRFYWLYARAGKTGFGFVYVISIRHDWAAVELYIDTHDREENKHLFDMLHRETERIEAAFGAPLDWQRRAGKRASRVRFLVQQGAVANETGWPQLQDAMISAMDRLSAALQPYIGASAE